MWILDCFFFLFFFSSRRRHTRSLRDWSSDVCSSDLDGSPRAYRGSTRDTAAALADARLAAETLATQQVRASARALAAERRSEERRVGKECRSRWARRT